MSIISSILGVATSAVGGGIGGAALGLIPEGIKFFDDKDQRKHELEMTRVQLDVDKARASQQIDLVHANAEVATDAGELDVLREQIKAQAQPSGVRWVDGLSATVRPFVTYLFTLLYMTYKGLLAYVALAGGATLIAFAETVFTPSDSAIFSGILSFWFITRHVNKMRAGG